MDLVGAESRRSGTRGGRSLFSWDDVRPEERSYYLGNSTAAAQSRHARRGLESTPADWYARPATRSGVARLAEPAVSCAEDRRHRVGTVIPTNGMDSASNAQSKIPTVTNAKLVKDQNNNAEDLDVVRRRERAMLDAALCGKSFSEAVRAALSETVLSAGEDGPESAAEEKISHERVSDAADAAASDEVLSNPNCPANMKIVRTAEHRLEKQRRREERAQRREERRLRRIRRRDSSESERESFRWRKHEQFDRRRRRRKHETDREEENRRSTRRSRRDYVEDESEDSELAVHVSRRQRLG